ncbi:MAG: HAD-IA family hydrolase, partial [Sphaerochaetaceae bacterium]|nr:HAD-IA family hydrolase [Sphaerochaetaceae bacterium]
MINGILFDMDGVLIDSEQYINKAAVEFFSRKHVKVRSEDFIPYVGAGENNYLGKVAEKYGYPIDLESAKIETYTIYGELIEGKEQALPGVIRFIKNAHKADIAMGIATSADRMKMEINLKVMGLDPAWFKVLLNGRDVERKKPYPDMYVEAAKKMGVPIEQCVVFEDAINGVQAA